jgi:hypothetical protein
VSNKSMPKISVRLAPLPPVFRHPARCGTSQSDSSRLSRCCGVARCYAKATPGSRPSSVGCPGKSVDLGCDTVQNRCYRVILSARGHSGAPWHRERNISRGAPGHERLVCWSAPTPGDVLPMAVPASLSAVALRDHWALGAPRAASLPREHATHGLREKAHRCGIGGCSPCSAWS